MRNPLLAAWVCILLGLASSSEGQDWAKAMFSETSHDFGVVARGAKVEYKFTLENIYEEDARITSVSSSCTCTTPKIDKKFLKTWEKATLTATIDTRAFLGRKDATITVYFDQPFSAEVQIHVYTYIRSDVVVQPGAVQFGTVNQGVAMKQKVSVSYAGRDDWRIQGVESANPNLEGRVTELSRGGGLVKYELWTTLKANAPAGYIQDQLILVTNDRDQRAARVPVAVEGIVSAALSVRPSPLFMGVIETGQSITKPLVIQGKTPFKIIAARANDPRFEIKIPEGAKAVQLLPITFNAKEVSGRFTGKIRIETDYPQSKTLQAEVNVQVTPPTASGK